MKQLSIIEALEKAEQLKEAGIQQAVNHADAVEDHWSDRAIAYFIEHLNTKEIGYKFLSEDIRYAAEANGFPKPPSARAWASVVVKVRNKGYIKPIGIANSINPNCHKAYVTKWEKIK